MVLDKKCVGKTSNRPKLTYQLINKYGLEKYIRCHDKDILKWSKPKQLSSCVLVCVFLRLCCPHLLVYPAVEILVQASTQ